MRTSSLLALALLFGACTGDRMPAEEAEPAEMAEEATTPPSSFVYIQHEVQDFDAWLPVYQGFEGKRAESGVVAMWAYRDLDNPNVVHALHGAADVETLRKFTAMDELAKGMAEAGVVGEPRFDFMNAVVETLPPEMPQSQYSLLVRHEVSDWDAWKAAFDAHKSARDAAGLTSRGVARGADDPNNVYINFAVSDLEKARAFVASDDLKAAMEGAGVVGAPEIYFCETVESM